MIQETEPEQKVKKGYKFRRGFKAWAEKVSLEYRKSLNLEPYDYLCAFKLSEYLKIDVVNPEDIFGMDELCLDLNNGTWSALTMKDDMGDDFIVHNGTHSSARQQSDIMHEISHVICKHPLERTGIRQGFPYLRNYNEEQEKEALWLGGCLQLPRPCLIFAIRKRMTIGQISDHFNASESMVKFRINMTGIKKQFALSF